MASESRHLSVLVGRPIAEVYAYASDPSHLPDWAPGLCTSIARVGDHWVAESAMGSIVVRYAEPNPFGVIDHDVVLESGETFHNPVRVLPHDDGAEVVFTLRRQEGMSDDDFDRDAAAVLADLVGLKELLESATT
jgi:uncharacterized protein YndB with AHSA1/START domain